MREKPEIGSCSQAEEFFLEIAHGRVRRGGKVNLFVDGDGRPLLVEKMALGESHRPDLLLYQAGADGHVDDPRSLVGLSTRQWFERDLTVFRIARSRGIPLVFVVAGGYQDAERVARLNANTVRAARRVWS